VEAAGRIHSRATIRVLNGHTGRVFAGQQRNIVLQQIGEGGATASVEAVNIGTTLEVQPRLGDGEEVVLRLNVDVNSLGGTDPETGLPVLLLRSAGARARVRDGETVLIAGVKLSEESRQVRAIPLLGQLPLIGELFRAPDRVRSEKQLAIFVTPRIIRGEVAKQGVPTYG
jgi:type II secretory pathway component GspD/PulD (secretin)